MRIFKKIALILLIIMIATTLKVYAGTTEVKLTASSTKVKVGDTITVTLSGTRGNGIEGFDAVLKYDKTKLELTNENQLAGEGFQSLSGTDDLTGEFKLSLMYTGSGTGPTTETNLAQLKFKVLDGAKVDEVLPIELTGIKVIDSELNGTDVENKKVELTVIKNSTTPGGNTNTPDPGGNTNNPNPGGNNNPSENYPYAGTKSSISIIAFVVAIIAVAIYMRINKYRDIK